MYVAFDIIHDGISSVAHKPLTERLKILERMVLPRPEGSESACVRGGRSHQLPVPGASLCSACRCQSAMRWALTD